VLRQELGDLRAALADFDRALEIDPGHVATYVNRGAARMEAGDLAGALTDFECAMAEAAPGTEAIIYHQRGGVRVLLNDFAGAIADYDRALALVPEDVVCYISRGNARYHRRDPGALADYRAAFHLDPESAAREVVRILAEDVRRRAEEVLDNCDQHLRISDRDLIAHARRGLTLVLLGREAEAAPDFARCRELAPDMDSCLSRVTRLSCQHRTTQGAVQL
jgi:tetratricopeptide (TPR) repeat protein